LEEKMPLAYFFSDLNYLEAEFSLCRNVCNFIRKMSAIFYTSCINSYYMQ